MRFPCPYSLIATMALFGESDALLAAGEQLPDTSATAGTNAAQLTGVWRFPMGNLGPNARIELRGDGHYEWWNPYLQSDLSAKTMIQAGTWVVQKHTLILHIQDDFIDHISPGTDISFDMKSVSSQQVVLNSPFEKREVTWTRVSPRDEPFWKRAIFYKAPFEMHSYLNATNTSPLPGDWELTASRIGSTDAGAKVVFHLSILAELIQAESPKKPIRNVIDLKDFMDLHLRTSPDGSNILTSITRIDGIDALKGVSTVPQKGEYGLEWQCAISFFWQTNEVWQKSTVCSITLTAEKKETFDLLTDSLESIKLLRKQDEK